VWHFGWEVGRSRPQAHLIGAPSATWAQPVAVFMISLQPGTGGVARPLSSLWSLAGHLFYFVHHPTPTLSS
jgi:hypothetical protein